MTSLRFRRRLLTERGAGGDNRPVLLRPSNRVITFKEAENELEFKAVEVFASRLKVNARMVEAALQMRFQFLKLGVRLWRGRAAFVERLKAATAAQ